jgi:hypothetical protein
LATNNISKCLALDALTFNSPMVQNNYSETLPQTQTLLPNPRVLDFLKMYSKSVEVKKSKNLVVLLGKN